jgi:hypothetical protein
MRIAGAYQLGKGLHAFDLSELGEAVEKQPVTAADIENVRPPLSRLKPTERIYDEFRSRTPPPVLLVKIPIALSVLRVHGSYTVSNQS